MVKGRERATRIYTLLLGNDPDQLARLQLEHKTFLDAYRLRQWNEAEYALSACREIGIETSITRCFPRA